MPRRITPAGAGKTDRKAPGKSYKEDHPRRCGENLRLHLFMLLLVGSPPQVRGKLSRSTDNSNISRITPAGAGKTNVPSLLSGMGRDHPRRCGENTKKIL